MVYRLYNLLFAGRVLDGGMAGANVSKLFPNYFAPSPSPSVILDDELIDSLFIFAAAQGVYIFPRLTLLGFNKQDPLVRRLDQLGLKLEDGNARCEGLEIRFKSPFCLMRTLAEEFGYKIIKMVPSDAPGDRSGLMWTLVVEQEEGRKGVESVGIVADVKREGRETGGETVGVSDTESFRNIQRVIADLFF